MNLVSRSQRWGQVRDRSHGLKPVALAPAPGGWRPTARPPYVPKSVQACGARSWHLELKRKATGEVSRVRFRCKTWRCPDCRRGVAAVDFARISEALAGIPEGECLYMVATLDQRADAARGMTAEDAYGDVLVRRLQSFIQWIRRNHDPRARYVLTVEQHRTGWPHVNIIFHAPELARLLAVGPKRQDGLAPYWLCKAAVSCGLGRRLWAEGPRSSGKRLAAYIVKLAHQETLPLAGEVAKLAQVPVTAPRGFRRLRASRGFLPKRMGRGEYTGKLHRKPLEAGLALDAFLATFAPLPPGTEPQGGPKGGEAPAQPPTGASGGGGVGTEVRSAPLVSTRTSHSASRRWTPKVLPGRRQAAPEGLGGDGPVGDGPAPAGGRAGPDLEGPDPTRPGGAGSLDPAQKSALNLVPHSNTTPG